MANPSPLPSPATHFTVHNQPANPEDKLSPKAQLKRMQRALYRMVVSEQEDPRINASCACAWERLEARKAVLCGKPGSITSKAEPPSKGKVNRTTRRPHDAPDEAPTPSVPAPAQVQPVAPQPVVLPSPEAGPAT